MISSASNIAPEGSETHSRVDTHRRAASQYYSLLHSIVYDLTSPPLSPLCFCPHPPFQPGPQIEHPVQLLPPAEPRPPPPMPIKLTKAVRQPIPPLHFLFFPVSLACIPLSLGPRTPDFLLRDGAYALPVCDVYMIPLTVTCILPPLPLFPPPPPLYLSSRRTVAIERRSCLRHQLVAITCTEPSSLSVARDGLVV